MSRKFLIGLILTLSFCLVITLAGIGIVFMQFAEVQPGSQGGTTPAPALSAPIPPLPATPLAQVSNATVEALARTNVPPRDLNQIVPRLRKGFAPASAQPTPAPRTRRVGDKDQFFVIENASTGKYRSMTASLQVITPNVYAWVEDGLTFDRAALQRAVEFFESKIYPTNQTYFGAQRAGVNGETRLHVLNTKFADAAGYFSRTDLYPRGIAQFSNERNILYLNVEATKPGTDFYHSVLAHEFQHLINAHHSTYSTGWIDEGLGELAIKVNGLTLSGALRSFAENPNTQLNTWASGPNESGPHYAASYLFFNYAASRFGPEFIRDVIRAPRPGIEGVQSILDRRAGGMRFEELFADWVVANYLNDAKVESGVYAYPNENFRITSEARLASYPRVGQVEMKQYAAEYFALSPSGGDVTIYFTGTTSARLLPVDARSGRWMWWSNRGDNSNMSLTRAVNLTNVSKATLQFWAWYDIEKDFDYAYVLVSPDNGRTWDTLQAKTTTTDNPNGANYGNAFTAKSGTADDKTPAEWIQEQVDLTPYAGKRILLRFEYITDDAYNSHGLALDDISIPEIQLNDDVEGGAGDWQATGFVRVENVLPQHYAVQIVECCNPTRLARLKLDAQNRGSYTTNGFGNAITRVTLIITPFAPVTTVPTRFQYAVVPK